MAQLPLQNNSLAQDCILNASISAAKNACGGVTPVVCEMFLGKQASPEVFAEKPAAGKTWELPKRRKKRLTWPDRPVLFDDIERCSMDAGYASSLMYPYNSPGLLRIKNRVKSGKQK